MKAGGAKSVEGKKLLDTIVKLTDTFRKQTEKLKGALDHGGGDSLKHAKYFRDGVIPAMVELRKTADALEGIVPHGVWMLPTYREMLFVSKS